MGSASDRLLSEDVPTHPGVHRNGPCGSGVDRTGGAELSDRKRHLGSGVCLRSEPRALLAKEQNTALRQLIGFQRYRIWEVVDTNDWQVFLSGPRSESTDIEMMPNSLIAISDHRPSAVPALPTDDMNLPGEESVGGAHNGTDV